MTGGGQTLVEAGYMVCPDCPWPIHIRVPVDPHNREIGMDAVRLAATAHHRQHESDAEPI